VERRFAELQQLSRLGASLLEAELPPIERRVLERRSIQIIARANGATDDPRDVWLHAAPTAADRQLGWMPDTWIDAGTGAMIGSGLVMLVAVHVRGQPRDAVPGGQASAICVRFLVGRVGCVEALPLLGESDGDVRLWLGSQRDRERTRW